MNILPHKNEYVGVNGDGKKCPKHRRGAREGGAGRGDASDAELHIKCIFYSFFGNFCPAGSGVPAGPHILPCPVTVGIETYDRGPSLGCPQPAPVRFLFIIVLSCERRLERVRRVSTNFFGFSV